MIVQIGLLTLFAFASAADIVASLAVSNPDCVASPAACFDRSLGPSPRLRSRGESRGDGRAIAIPSHPPISAASSPTISLAFAGAIDAVSVSAGTSLLSLSLTAVVACAVWFLRSLALPAALPCASRAMSLARLSTEATGLWLRSAVPERARPPYPAFPLLPGRWPPRLRRELLIKARPAPIVRSGSRSPSAGAAP